MNQRDADEQVVVQPPAPVAPAGFARLAHHALAALVAGQQQLVLIEKAHEFFHLLGIDRQRRAGLDVGRHLRRVARPAQQTLVFQPTDAVEAVAHRVLNRPGGRAIGARARGVQAQVLAQCLADGRRTSADHSPVHSRTLASGRRIR